MARDDGVRMGAGGQAMLQEIVEVPEVPKPKATTLAEKQEAKVEVLEERLVDLPSDVEAEIDGD
jgi:hypothetical protein